jgi:hypothetical protein
LSPRTSAPAWPHCWALRAPCSIPAPMKSWSGYSGALIPRSRGARPGLRRTASRFRGPREPCSRRRASRSDWRTGDSCSRGEESAGLWWRRAWGGSG